MTDDREASIPLKRSICTIDTVMTTETPQESSAVLQTSRGEFVARVAVPFFIYPPGVLIWGDRVFVISGTDEKRLDPAYREAFAASVSKVLPQ